MWGTVVHKYNPSIWEFKEDNLSLTVHRSALPFCLRKKNGWWRMKDGEKGGNGKGKRRRGERSRERRKCELMNLKPSEKAYS